MTDGIKQLPPSRRDKKQIAAHLDPDLVEAVHRRRKGRAVTAQEMIAEAINVALASYGRDPILPVKRDRLVKREKALAQVEGNEGTPRCRQGKRRLAGFFDNSAVDAVKAFSAEHGVRTEDLVEFGLRAMIPASEIEAAKRAA